MRVLLYQFVTYLTGCSLTHGVSDDGAKGKKIALTKFRWSFLYIQLAAIYGVVAESAFALCASVKKREPRRKNPSRGGRSIARDRDRDRKRFKPEGTRSVFRCPVAANRGNVTSRKTRSVIVSTWMLHPDIIDSVDRPFTLVVETRWVNTAQCCRF